MNGTLIQTLCGELNMHTTIKQATQSMVTSSLNLIYMGIFRMAAMMQAPGGRGVAGGGFQAV